MATTGDDGAATARDAAPAFAIRHNANGETMDDAGGGVAYRPAMSAFRRFRLWREPPILFQILVLLLGGLVVAQFVTLFLTLVLPPAPPVQHSLGDIAAALRHEADAGAGNAPLSRTVQAGPPDVSGPGWFMSDASRHDLAVLLGARDGDVRLAFYAPLPFAGTTALPPRDAMPASSIPASAIVLPRRIAWQSAPEPLRALAVLPAPEARLTLAALSLDQMGPPAPGGGGPGGGFPGGGFPGGRDGFPGGDMRGGGPSRTGGQLGDARGGGRAGAQPNAADILRQDQLQSGRGTPSPADLARQPMAPGAAFDEDRGAAGAAYRPQPDAMPSSRWPGDYGTQLPLAPALPAAAVAPQDMPAETAERAPAAPSHAPVASTTASPAVPVPPADTTAATQATTPARAAVLPPEPESAIPIAPPSRALFGLAPAPFVEGDFVAAARLPDGRWVVVQPTPEGFPNAWQRRVILWFVIAFAIVAPIGWLFARHIVRPLARFTEAAEQLGRDPSAALVTLKGPAEIGRAARAFNIMQNRLRSFVDDRTAMVGAISHDLRTPLTRLRFRIEDVDDEAVRDGMNAEVSEMEAMISSVLTFIRDASTPGVRERLDLGLLVEDAAEDAALVGGEVTVERMIHATVEVDALGMRRLIANLVENAVKYGKRARIRLAVEEDVAIADILDDGPGVPEEELERAFEPFYRASNALASGKGGTGLGLAVCRSIARAHGGDVRLIRSTEGFAAQLRLPLAYDAERAAA